MAANEINVEGFEFYAVRNQDGQWFRAKGYGGYGSSWTDDPKRARIYQKIGQARSRVTFWANNYPDYGVPDLVRFTVSGAEVIDESDRVKKAKEKKEKWQANQELRYRKHQLKTAQQKLAAAQAEIEKLQNG